MKICLTGATGFIGKNLLKELETTDNVEVIALSRKISPIIDGAKKGNVTWRRCNGFSLLDAENATKGADILIYLIHSMLPASTLTQGTFSDFDLYLADNFARAAKKNGIKRIVYLSGLIPDTPNLSDHLVSRLEVEKTLSQYGNSLTVLRAGLIIGKDGSSFKILERLIKRLPILICPTWTLSRTQPIDIRDVLASLKYCIKENASENKIYDIGGPDIINYREMLHLTAQSVGLKKKIINVSFISQWLSKLWVAKITSTSANLVYPLVESLRHNMVVDEKKQLTLPDHKYIPFTDALADGISPSADGWVRSIVNYNARINFRILQNVTSMQRIDNQVKSNAEEVAGSYFRWLPQFLNPFIKVILNDKHEAIFKFMNKWDLLILEKSFEREEPNRVLYYVTGGILSKKETLNGRLEFRWVESSKCVLIGLLDYRPSLPWFIYKYTQAVVHLFVMKRFEHYLENLSE